MNTSTALMPSAPTTGAAQLGKVATRSLSVLATSFLLLGLGAPGASLAAGAEWRLQLGGVSHHFQPTQAVGREWREQHPGLGLERRVQLDRWSLNSAGGILQDSRGFWGGYLGTAYMRTWRAPGNIELAAGAGAYGFYRSTSWNGKMALIPGVLPTASVFIPSANMGLNFIYVPQIGNYNKSMPAVLHAQLTYRFGS